MIIGITGSIGSGKTTVAVFFKNFGFLVIDADEIGHAFLRKGTKQFNELVKHFGKEILDKDGNIDRMKLGEIAFSEKKKYRALNSIMLPPILKEIKRQINKSKALEEDAALDAPILLETDAKDLVDKIVVVNASNENIIKRNRKFSKKQIINVKHYQMPAAEKIKHADYVINNNVNLGNLESQVRNVINAA